MQNLPAYNSFFSEVIKTINSKWYQAFKSLNKFHIGQNFEIEIILCPLKDNLEVEYALKTSNKPIGVSEYRLTRRLPEKFRGKVPTSTELKLMLAKAIKNGGEIT